MKKRDFLNLIMMISCVACSCTLQEPPSVNEKCPPSDGELAYILDAEGNRCEAGEGCFEDAFALKRCPKDYRCSFGEDKYYCFKGCGTDQIRCGDQCVDPQSSNTACGASGLCNEDNESGGNYKGMDCGDRAKCEEGTCRCIFDSTSTAFCGAKGTCNSLDPESENYEGTDCGENATCESGSCQCGTLTQCGSAGFSQCVDLQSNNSHCGACGSKCEDGQCVNGHCIKNNCPPNTCNRDECKNDDARCGENCENCININESKVCDVNEGICRSCRNNEAYYQEYHKCLPNNIETCKRDDQPVSEAINCLEGRNSLWNTIYCEDGKCKVTCNGVVDENGNYYHLDATGEHCEIDTDTVCGELKKDCTAKDENGSYVVDINAESVACEKGKCVAKKCKLSSYAMPLLYYYDLGGHYVEEHLDIELNYFPEHPGMVILGHYRMAYVPNSDGKCEKINAQGFCGMEGLDCGSKFKCVGREPGCRCIGTEYVCNECVEEASAKTNDYCVLNYSCTCPKGMHTTQSNGCKYDDMSNCGGDGVVCSCDGIADCKEVACRDGKCVLTACENGKKVCKKECVGQMTLCLEDYQLMPDLCGKDPDIGSL